MQDNIHQSTLPITTTTTTTTTTIKWFQLLITLMLVGLLSCNKRTIINIRNWVNSYETAMDRACKYMYCTNNTPTFRKDFVFNVNSFLLYRLALEILSTPYLKPVCNLFHLEGKNNVPEPNINRSGRGYFPSQSKF